MLCLALMLSSTICLAQDDFASPGDNILPKKETFTQKIKRYEESGFYIAVPESTVGIMIRDMSEIRTNLSHKEEAKECRECTTGKSGDLASKLNDAFGTTIFEAVDASKFPTMKQWGIEVPAYGKTKYKLVISTNVVNRYEVTDGFMDNKGKLTATYGASVAVVASEYHLKKGKDKIKQMSQASMLLFPVDKNEFISESQKSDPAEVSEMTWDEIKEAVGWPSDDDISQAYAMAVDTAADKLITKLKK